MAEYADREHYIPIRKSDVVQLLCHDLGDSTSEADEFRQLAKLLESTFHFEFHQKLEDLKDAYAPFDPDADTKDLLELKPEEKHQRLDDLVGRFVWLLERANFCRLTSEDIDAALKDGTEWGLQLDVDLKVFEKLEIFTRGESTVRRKKRHWSKLYREQEIEIPVYQRLVVILRLRPSKRLPKTIDTNNVYIKVFKDIPKKDLEMLLPGSQVKMTLTDRSKIGLPLATGVGITGYKLAAAGTAILFSALTSMSNTIVLLTLAGGTIGYGLRSFYGYQQTKQKYQLTLTESLYFHNLDNNAGVLFRLLDEAEEQENREALLAYYFLWREAGNEGWTPEHLDDRVEEFLEKAAGVKVDFEIGDALDKVKRLGLVEELPEGRLRAAPIQRALEALDYAWDNYFKYNNAGSESAPV